MRRTRKEDRGAISMRLALSRQLGRSMPEGEAIPHVTQTNFVALLIGYLVLVAGNLFEGV